MPCLALRSAAGPDEIWIEAESFQSLGGWFVDQQSFGQMGSAYIMAHGIGVPVEDAKTTATVPADGAWHVWVRTRDWTAPWKRGTPAGRFKLVVNGESLPEGGEALGTNGADWAWQKAGVVDLKRGPASLALHDLTGFNGRCDAIYLTTDLQSEPPRDGEALAAFRRKVTGTVLKDDPKVYDLAVAGGGVSGMCVALAAARTGSQVILIQDRGVLGGNNSSEIRVPMGGLLNKPPYPNLGRVVREISPAAGGPGIHPTSWYEDTRKENIFRTDRRCRLVLNTRVVGVERDKTDPRKIAAYIARDIFTGKETRIRAKLFADCTGDAVIARMMGAEVMYGRESRDTYKESLAPKKADNQVMGMSVMWRSRREAKPVPFPDIDWGIAFDEEHCYYVRAGDWEWETGQYRNQADETEYIRDYGLMTIYGNWSYLKNHAKRKAEWAKDRIFWVSPLGGKRESYRVVGDYVMTQKDIEDNVEHPDATGSITWNIDLHFPDPIHEELFKEPFRSCAYHRNILKAYPVPYRCLYAKDVPNLFLAGRHISVSHIAFGPTRVMRTLGVLGEVVGMAASICRRHDAYPRDVYTTYLDELKDMMVKGVPYGPTYHPGGYGSYYDGYHFKDTGHLQVSPRTDPRLERDPSVKKRVAALGLEHLVDRDRNKRTSDGTRGLKRFLDGWVDATPKNTTVLVEVEDMKQDPGWSCRSGLPLTDWPSIIGNSVWEASGKDIATLVTTVSSLKPGATYQISAIFIGIDPKRKPMKWGIDAGLAPEKLTAFTLGTENVRPTGNITDTGTGIQLLAPLGVQTADAEGEIRVYVNTSNYGPGCRTRYDGIGYKAVANP
jgi:hypothetical protein